MPRQDSAIARRARSHGRGFTLVELVSVVVILGVLSVTATLALSKSTQARQSGAARQLARDLNFARARALATGAPTWVSFSYTGNSYSVLAENPASPGRAGAIALTDPSTGGSFVVRFNTAERQGVSLVTVSIPGGGTDLGFDWLGRPQNGAGTLLASNAVVTLTGPVTATVTAGTGLATSP